MVRGPWRTPEPAGRAGSPGSGRSAAADPGHQATPDPTGHSPARPNRWRSRAHALTRSRFGAVCPGCGTAAGRVLPFVNTAAMNAHPAGIAGRVAPGAHAILVLDGAGWHSSKTLAVPENISLLPLPPHSPAPDQVRGYPGSSPGLSWSGTPDQVRGWLWLWGWLWDYLRANWLAISVFDDYPAIVDACGLAWNRFADDPKTVTSITDRQWAQVNL